MTLDLEKERLKLEIKRVGHARDEMEFNILERQADIDRLKKQIEIQEKRIQELKDKLGDK